MIIQILAAVNCALAIYDANLTRRRIRDFGTGFELNRLIRWLATHTGPELASVIGILGPVVGWTYILSYFNQPVLLAIWVGYALKRFEIQLSSAVFEKRVRDIKKMLEEYRGANEATLPSGESTPPAPRSISREGK